MNNYVLIKLWLKFPWIQLMKIFSWFGAYYDIPYKHQGRVQACPDS